MRILSSDITLTTIQFADSRQYGIHGLMVCRITVDIA